MSTTTTTVTQNPAHPEDNIALSSISRPPPIATSPKNHRLGTSEDLSSQSKNGEASAPGDVDLESQPSTPKDAEIPPQDAVSAQTSAMDRNMWWKTASTFYSLWIAGVNDGSFGALLPYLKDRYNIGLEFVAFVYIAVFMGWLTAALTNVHITARLGMGGALFVGSCFQLLSYLLQCWEPPYAVFVVGFYFVGLGCALQDAQTNTFNANLPRAHVFLGIAHGLYGMGALVAPLMATAIANSTPDFKRWYYFYYIAVGLSTMNSVFIGITFREVLWVPFARHFRKFFGGKASDNEGQQNVVQRADKRNQKQANQDFKTILKRKEVWILAAYFFMYVGAEVTAGGWVVEFMIEIRHGKPSRVGYIASAFWGGLTLGRFVLAEPTNRYGERRMVLIYTILAVAVELVFWFVPSIVVGGVMIGILGFLIGPFFPVGISLATKLIPRELHAGAIGFMTVVGSAGGAAFPFMTGAIASKKGVQVLQPILCALFVMQVILWISVPKVSRRQS